MKLEVEVPDDYQFSIENSEKFSRDINNLVNILNKLLSGSNPNTSWKITVKTGDKDGD